mmetsp:Transcript_11168/g.31342  ORF Transcript_11168/g.31342 Transcript_11168/m.31342 type:complete len:94 (+) Transcript_11168:468-749(+)
MSKFPFRDLYQNKIASFFGNPKRFLNQHTHSKLLSKFIITLSMSKDDLTPKMNEVLKGAQVRIPGEKTFMWRGKSPFIIMVKSTIPTPVGLLQ